MPYADRDKQLAAQRASHQKRKLAKLTQPAPNSGQPIIDHTALFSASLRAASGARVYYNPDEAVRASRRDAEAMERDLSILGPLQERIDGVSLLKHHLEPEDKFDQQQAQFATDVGKIIDRLPDFLSYKKALLWGTFWGRSAISNTFSFTVTDDGQQSLEISDWYPIAGDKIVYAVGGRLGLRVGYTDPSVEQYRDKIEMTREGRVLFMDDWMRKFYVVHEHQRLDAAFEDYQKAGMIFGTGIRDRVYWAWKLKNQALGWCMDLLQRWGSGLSIFYYVEGDPDSFTKVKALAEAQANNTALLIGRPMGKDEQGAGFEHFEVNGRGIDDMRSILENYFESHIRRYIIGQSLSSDTASTGLGSGVADLHADTKDQIIRGDAINLAETFTKQLVQPLVAYNRAYYPHWPDNCQLKFQFEIDSPNVKELLEAAEKLAGMGIRVDEDELRGLTGLRKPQEVQPTQFSLQHQERVKRLAASWKDRR
jgi:hypothetical protein